MSQVIEQSAAPAIMDPYEIGWYIESADEEIYGPVSRKTLRRFLEESAITPNTLVRHCTQPAARPLADQAGVVDPLSLEGKDPAAVDRLEEVWPKKKRDRQSLAEDSLTCAWHKKRPAMLVCLRCHAPYCGRCRAKPFRKQFFLCRRCQAGMHNRRFIALMVDSCVLVYLPMFAFGAAISLAAPGEAIAQGAVTCVQLAGIGLLLARDSLFGGAGLGKRAVGLRVVKTSDGTSPLSYGQGCVRWLSQFIPFFNLADAIVPYGDPLFRRYGDRWAKTRVIDREKALAKARAKVAKRLLKKGIQPPQELAMTMSDLARLA